MSSYKPYTESDWKLFRSRIANWQETYMERLLDEYGELITEDALPHERFWRLQERITHDQHSPGVTIEMKRSALTHNLIALLEKGVIEESDLEGFSEELKSLVIQSVRHEL